MNVGCSRGFDTINWRWISIRAGLIFWVVIFIFIKIDEIISVIELNTFQLRYQSKGRNSNQ